MDNILSQIVPYDDVDDFCGRFYDARAITGDPAILPGGVNLSELERCRYPQVEAALESLAENEPEKYAVLRRQPGLCVLRSGAPINIMAFEHIAMRYGLAIDICAIPDAAAIGAYRFGMRKNMGNWDRVTDFERELRMNGHHVSTCTVGDRWFALRA